MTDIYKMETQ